MEVVDLEEEGGHGEGELSPQPLADLPPEQLRQEAAAASQARRYVDSLDERGIEERWGLCKGEKALFARCCHRSSEFRHLSSEGGLASLPTFF